MNYIVESLIFGVMMLLLILGIFWFSATNILHSGGGYTTLLIDGAIIFTFGAAVYYWHVSKLPDRTI